MNILIIDVGTTSMRGVLYASDGHVLGMKRTPNHEEFFDNGWATEPVSDWDQNLQEIFSTIVHEHGADCFDAVAITSQRSSIIPMDRDGRALMDTIMWQDTRNASICKVFAEKNAEIFPITGSRVNTVYSGSKMTWVKRETPDAYAQLYKFVNIPEYMIYLMTGEFQSDVTYGSRTGLMNLAGKDWDENLLDLYEVKKEHLCKLNEAGAVVGMISEEWASLTGCKAGIPVISAGGDQQCGAIGQGVAKPGNLSIVTGTGAYGIAACGDIPKDLKDDVTCNASSIPGSYQLEANIITCANAFDWAIRTLYGMEEIDYGLIGEELAAETEVAGCTVVPYFKGTGAPDWNPNATATFAGVTLATRRSEMLKAVLEGIFMEMANKIDSIARYMDIDKVYVSGGMTNSDTICQLQADIYGREILIKKDAETTAFGAFLVAMVSLGQYPDMEAAQAALNPMEDVKVFAPDPQKHAAYQAKQKKMNRIYAALREE
ncbi:MAG: hypothetical protein IJI24_07465 [Lachnospiraceae bacterium]|nr:hypothetical protein [Lachnospiraceae bacterium]